MPSRWTWNGLIILFLSVAFAAQANAAVPSEAQIRAALIKASYLTESAKIAVSVDPKQADSLFITMFRHQDANDKDCKIDALLIGKTVIDLSNGDINKVTVYFYSLTMSSYKAVTIRNVDIKAFASGTVDKDEFLKTLDLTSGRVGDNPAQLERFLQEKQAGPSDVSAAIVSDELQIRSSAIDPSNETNARIDALHLALAALPVLRASVQKITVTFGTAESAKSITFAVSDLKSLSQQVQTILAPVVVSSADENKHAAEKK